MLLRFGGHRQAAGLQIDAARVKEFRQAVNEWGETRLQPDDLRPRLWLDGPLAFAGITSHVMSELSMLAPFGPGNAKPIFHTGPVQVVDGPRKLKDRHLKMSFRQNGRTFQAIHWNAAEREAALTEQKASVELAFSLEQNEFQGNTYLELRVEDFR
jgi:single-stranded-DNA-specific exonuclease